MTVMLSRRSLIKASLSAAGGLMIAAFAPEFASATAIAGEPWSPEAGKSTDEVNAFVVIDPENAITLRVANNLIDGNVYRSMGTWSSGSVRGSRVFLQQAGASARARLVAAAAARWGVQPAACVASNGLIRHQASGRSATFGELAADAAKVTLSAEPTIKTPDQFRLIGKEIKSIDTPLKVTGSACFGIDVRLPGMAYAAAANCPVFGGKLKSYDFSAISGRRGIIAAVPVTNGVAVVADNFWRAKEALRAMPIAWDFGPAASTDSAGFAAEYRAALDAPLADGGGHGDIAAAFAKPAKVVEALYEVPYLAHAPMEPAQCDRGLARRSPRNMDGNTGSRIRG
jgi:isoquinoline 1-oxidoreductase beta subunit